jgi:hypothetical protein
MFLLLCVVDYLRWSKEQLQLFEVVLEFSRDVREKSWCRTMPRGSIVDGAAMAIGNTDDWCRVDAEVSGEGGEVGSELDSEEMSGSERLCRAR